MVKSKEKPFGYIYRATNIHNGKIYFGQTVTHRWGEDKNPIEERWNEEAGQSYRREKKGEELRYIENIVFTKVEEELNHLMRMVRSLIIV